MAIKLLNIVAKDAEAGEQSQKLNLSVVVLKERVLSSLINRYHYKCSCQSRNKSNVFISLF